MPEPTTQEIMEAVKTLGGMPYVIMPDMPEIASSALAFGDFRRGYTVTVGLLRLKKKKVN